VSNTKNLVETVQSQFRKGSTQLQVFKLLSDQKWHCRDHEGKAIASAQYAGGGGIQGLQRGNKQRPGLVIETESKYCEFCRKKTKWDRWIGEIKSANSIEQRQREKHELVIDHRFPMERWGENEPPHLASITETEIKKKFQLLKKDQFGNNNLLKSRSCERCIKTAKRGTPFGIQFWYKGDKNWPSIHQRGAEAEEGCVGCGWYDFETWRNALNQKLAQSAQDD
jgi:hypothetical protein